MTKSLVLAAFLMPTMMMASGMIGGTTPGTIPGDWQSVPFYDNGNWGEDHYNITGVSLFRYAGDALVFPGVVIGGGWVAYFVNRNYAGISGPASEQSPEFTLSFNDIGASGIATYYYVAFGENGPYGPGDPMAQTFGPGVLGYGLITFYRGVDFTANDWQPLVLAVNGFHPIVEPTVPEPTTFVSMLAGAGLIAFFRRVRPRFRPLGVSPGGAFLFGGR